MIIRKLRSKYSKFGILFPGALKNTMIEKNGPMADSRIGSPALPEGGRAEERNQQTSIPVRETPGGAVIGIIAVLKDINPEAALHAEETRFVVLHQRTIEVDFHLGRGTRLIVSIPLMPRESTVFEGSI